MIVTDLLCLWLLRDSLWLWAWTDGRLCPVDSRLKHTASHRTPGGVLEITLLLPLTARLLPQGAQWSPSGQNDRAACENADPRSAWRSARTAGTQAPCRSGSRAWRGLWPFVTFPTTTAQCRAGLSGVHRAPETREGPGWPRGGPEGRGWVCGVCPRP